MKNQEKLIDDYVLLNLTPEVDGHDVYDVINNAVANAVVSHKERKKNEEV